MTTQGTINKNWRVRRGYRHSTTRASNPIGHRIMLLAARQKLSHAYLARMLGVPGNTLKNWLMRSSLIQGKWPRIPAGVIVPLARILRCDPLYLLCATDDVTPEKRDREFLSRLILTENELRDFIDKAERLREWLRDDRNAAERRIHDPSVNEQALASSRSSSPPSEAG